jgi:hypothetical protein
VAEGAELLTPQKTRTVPAGNGRRVRLSKKPGAARKAARQGSWIAKEGAYTIVSDRYLQSQPTRQTKARSGFFVCGLYGRAAVPAGNGRHGFFHVSLRGGRARY